MLDYRLGSVDDLDAVYLLNQQLFPEAWSKKSLLDVMLAGFDLYVCFATDELAGYLLSQDILDEVHIMQVAVAPAYQRQGVGTRLTQRLLTQKSGYDQALLEVRASNIAAQQLYTQLGFVTMGCRKKYYTPEKVGGEREDAVVMQLRLANG